MKTLETPRLVIEELTVEDAAFTLAILNDENFIIYVADRGIRTEEQAKTYIVDKICASYREHGFGMAAVRRKDNGDAIGMSLDSMIRLTPEDEEICMYLWSAGVSPCHLFQLLAHFRMQ